MSEKQTSLQTKDDLIRLLNVISIVAKRMADRLMSLKKQFSEMEEKSTSEHYTKT